MRLPEERTGRPAPPEIAARRQGMAEALAAGAWALDVPPVVEAVAGVRVLRFQPPAKRGTVLHLHGGGYRIGCPEMVGAFAAALAARCGVEVVCPAYRLAPENPFPAGLVDALAVHQVLTEADDGAVIVSGDSAGGGLAASLAAFSVEQGAPPSALVLLSPWLDLTVTSPAYQANAATDPLFSYESARVAAELYLQGHPPQDPLASPLFAPLAGYPPTLISAGSGEVLVEDARRFHQALRTAGVAASLCEIAGMDHVAVTRGLSLPGAAETFEAVAAFIDAVLGER
jgi:monoterpene epsilon-lactone hydrolase